jgi:WhiB family redox-sensing transcriptional regulator
MTICDLSDITVMAKSIPLRAKVASPTQYASASREAKSWLLTGLMESTSPMPELSDLIARPAWHQDAACRGQGSDRFILPKGSGEVREAKRICERCPVAAQCLSFALDDPGIKGIWAGTSARERDRMRAAARTARLDILATSPEATAAAS